MKKLIFAALFIYISFISHAITFTITPEWKNIIDNDGDGKWSYAELAFKITSVPTIDNDYYNFKVQYKKSWGLWSNLYTGGFFETPYSGGAYCTNFADATYHFRIKIEKGIFGDDILVVDEVDFDFLGNVQFEPASEDLLTFLIPSASWTNEIDKDGDGYTQYRKLEYQIKKSSIVSQHVNVTVKVFKKLSSSSTYSLWSTFPNFTMNYSIEGMVTDVGNNFGHDLYDFKIELYNNDDGGKLVAERDYYLDSDLYRQKFETVGQDEPVSLPSKPTDPYPSNGAINMGGAVNPSWNNGGGATSYKIYFGTDSSPDNGEYKGEITVTSYEPGTLTQNTTYYWRIDAVNSAGITSGNVWSFTTGAGPLPEESINPNPNNGATNQSRNADLSWSNGGGAIMYNVYFGTDPTPDSGEYRTKQEETSFNLGTLDYNTTYYWRIDPINYSGTTTGDVWHFTTEAEPVSMPNKATSPSPSNGATSQSRSVDVNWSNGGGATSYKVYFGASSSLGSSSYKGSQASTSYDPGTLDYNTTYYWRIDAVNSAGTTPGDVWHFNTEPQPVSLPNKATSPSPSNGATNESRSVDVIWSNGGGATSYKVYFGASSSLGSSSYKGSQASTSYDPGTLDYNTTYYWQIYAVNSGGTTMGDTWSFTTEVEPDNNYCNEQDSLALVAFYNSCHGDNWTNNTNWLETPVKDWKGITVENGRVTEVILNDNSLAGTLTNELADLTELKKLYLQNNSLSGTLQSLTNLTNLENIVADNNQFSGDLTPFSNKSNMYWISFENNQLTGTIEPLMGLAKLQGIYLNGNQLSGNIPASIGDLTQLTRLILYKNQLTGTIPAGIGQLSNLESLYLYSNQLNGTLPPEIGELVNLQHLYISNNQLSGELPTAIGNLTKLRYLGLFENNFSGQLPLGIGNLINLEILSIRDNNFSGTIPNNIGDFPKLLAFRIENNNYVHAEIEPCFNWWNYPYISSGFIYEPQGQVGVEQYLTIPEGEVASVTINNYTQSNNDIYQWFKNGNSISPPSSDPTYNISSFSIDDEGHYTCQITNSLVPGLTLESYPVTLTMKDSTSPTLTVTPSTGTDFSNQFEVSLIFSEPITGVPVGVSVDNGNAEVAGEGITYTVTINAADNTMVTLTIANTISDLSGNHFEGATYNYSIGDNTPPEIITCYPDKITIDDNHPIFNFSFNENVTLGSGKLDVIKKGSFTPILSIPLVESMIEGKDVIVSYETLAEGGLDLNTEYYVTIAPRTFTDFSGNEHTGITGSDEWYFTTGTNYPTVTKDMENTNYSIYPNPVTRVVQIEGLPMPKETTLSIYNAQGQLVIQQIVAADKTSLDISQQAPGIYLLIINNDKTQIFKIIKE